MTSSAVAFRGVTGLRFGDEVIVVSVASAAAAAMRPVLDFVQPHFELTAPLRRADAAVFLEFVERSQWSRPAEEGERTLVRRRTPGKHVFGERWRVDGRTILHVPSSDAVFDLADDGRQATVYVSSGSRYHASDLLRDIMWELAAPHGTFLHAAAVSAPFGAIAVTGPKGAGKTTTALDLMYAGCGSYTGDVLFLADGANQAYSFPDYPHVGWGTLRSFPDLFATVTSEGLTPSSDQDKVLLPFDLYQKVVGVGQAQPPLPLRVVVVPDVTADGPAEIAPTQPRPDLLAPMARQTSDPGQGWEPFLQQIRTRAAARHPAAARIRWLDAGHDLRWFARRGTGRLPAGQLRALLRSH